MQGRYEQQLKKGVLEMLVLKLLINEEKYGYQLISQLKEKSGGMFTEGRHSLSDFIQIRGRRPCLQPLESAKGKRNFQKILCNYRRGKGKVRRIKRSLERIFQSGIKNNE